MGPIDNKSTLVQVKEMISSAIRTKMQNVSFKKIYLKMSIGKWRSFCPRDDELKYKKDSDSNDTQLRYQRLNLYNVNYTLHRYVKYTFKRHHLNIDTGN